MRPGPRRVTQTQTGYKQLNPLRAGPTPPYLYYRRERNRGHVTNVTVLHLSAYLRVCGVRKEAQLRLLVLMLAAPASSHARISASVCRRHPRQIYRRLRRRPRHGLPGHPKCFHACRIRIPPSRHAQRHQTEHGERTRCGPCLGADRLDDELLQLVAGTRATRPASFFRR
jgi:hypothetical protein